MLEKISSSEILLNFSSNSDWICLSLQPVFNCIKIFTVDDMLWWSPWFFFFFASWFLYNNFFLYYLVIMHVHFLKSMFLLNQKVYNEVSQLYHINSFYIQFFPHGYILLGVLGEEHRYAENFSLIHEFPFFNFPLLPCKIAFYFSGVKIYVHDPRLSSGLWSTNVLGLIFPTASYY